MGNRNREALRVHSLHSTGCHCQASSFLRELQEQRGPSHSYSCGEWAWRSPHLMSPGKLASWPALQFMGLFSSFLEESHVPGPMRFAVWGRCSPCLLSHPQVSSLGLFRLLFPGCATEGPLLPRYGNHLEAVNFFLLGPPTSFLFGQCSCFPHPLSQRKNRGVSSSFIKSFERHFLILL